jgi:UDP-3-O-[3-hydroxymyristoyl] glucosamine N-acyltransferase
VVADPGLALIELLGWFRPPAPAPPAGAHPTAVVAASAEVHATASLGPYVVVGEGASIAANAVLHPHVVVGRDCRVGERAVLHPHAVLYDGTEVAADVIVHAGAVLGSDGFGYQSRPSGHHKVPQVGRVVVEAGVEIGANSTIDRALLTETRIGAGTKIDNLVQVGHNVVVGRHCLLCGQAGIAGSTTLEDWVVLAGQAGVVGHVTVGRGVQVAAKSALMQSATPGQQLAGIPAVELREWRRMAMAQSRLPELLRRVRALEARLAEPGRNPPPAAAGAAEE